MSITLLTGVAAFAALVAAGAACFAAWFTYQIMQSGQRQVDAANELVRVSLQEVQATIEAQRDAQLPVLMPSVRLDIVGQPVVDSAGHSIVPTEPGYDHNAPNARVKVMNSGLGLALNIQGIIFGPKPTGCSDLIIAPHHSYSFPLPLLPGAEVSYDWPQGGYMLNGDVNIGEQSLFAPPVATSVFGIESGEQAVARLVLTYWDIHGRKFAAIYDLTAQVRWVNIAYTSIEKDLRDLHREAVKLIPKETPQLPASEA